MDHRVTTPVARNVRRLAHLDLAGGGQILVENGYAYVGHMKPPFGTSIIDVSDPKKPRLVAQIKLDDEYSHTHKVRVVGDLMITNVEQNNRHFLRKAEKIPEIIDKLEKSLGRSPNDGELANELKLSEKDIPILKNALKRGYHDGGFKLYDISNRAQPKLIHHEKTYGFGVHRFDADENYAYISTEMPGFAGNILVNYDIKDPSRPTEISRWWLPGQHLEGGEQSTWEGHNNRLHHAMRVGDELWASVWHAGFRVIDVSNISQPKTVASYDYHPPFPEPTHTVMPLQQTIGGRRIAVGVDEEHEHTPGRLHAFLWLFDVSDYNNISTLSAFDVSELDSPWSRCAPGRFGAHQFREKLDSSLVYVTWFSGGLRIVDISDPLHPAEVGHYIPEPVAGNPSPQSNDVDVDDDGLIYLIDRNAGFDILEFKQ